jgi:catechol 2,3-dioxygenase-like lactoylglutathione lyase family enzyme
VTKDQEANRAFYEDLIGLPLIATWTEVDELFGAQRTYVHTFYGLGDGSALAFFQFAEPGDQMLFGPEIPVSPFIHIAMKVTANVQAAIQGRLDAASWRTDDTYVLEHGYCRSLYTTDPNGMLLEFTVDVPNVAEIAATRRSSATEDLKRWLGGDHSSNNDFRS